MLQNDTSIHLQPIGGKLFEDIVNGCYLKHAPADILTGQESSWSRHKTKSTTRVFRDFYGNMREAQKGDIDKEFLQIMDDVITMVSDLWAEAEEIGTSLAMYYTSQSTNKNAGIDNTRDEQGKLLEAKKHTINAESFIFRTSAKGGRTIIIKTFYGGKMRNNRFLADDINQRICERVFKKTLRLIFSSVVSETNNQSACLIDKDPNILFDTDLYINKYNPLFNGIQEDIIAELDKYIKPGRYDSQSPLVQFGAKCAPLYKYLMAHSFLLGADQKNQNDSDVATWFILSLLEIRKALEGWGKTTDRRLTEVVDRFKKYMQKG